jgi:hypothetical protein
MGFLIISGKETRLNELCGREEMTTDREFKNTHGVLDVLNHYL